MPLSDTQILILTTAAQRPDGIAAPPASLPSAPRAAVAKALLRAGLLAPDEAGHADPNSAWKLDGTMVVLRITEAGLRAVGVGPQGRAAALGEAIPEMPAAPAAAPVDAAATTMPADRHSESLSAAGAECASTAGQPADAAQGASVASHGATLCLSLRDAARAVLAAWDTAGQTELAGAIDVLQAALALRRVAPGAGSPRSPRPDTKQARVLALLRRDEGASGPAIIEATGWAPHTVRGFLAGLKQKGLTVETLDRVRQVGTNKPGGRGGYSVYRVASAVAG